MSNKVAEEETPFVTPVTADLTSSTNGNVGHSNGHNNNANGRPAATNIQINDSDELRRAFLRDPFSEQYPDTKEGKADKNKFWENVSKMSKENSMEWNEALTRCRLAHLKALHNHKFPVKEVNNDDEDDGMLRRTDEDEDDPPPDLLTVLVTQVHDSYHRFARGTEEQATIPAFIKQLSAFAKMMLKEDFESNKKHKDIVNCSIPPTDDVHATASIEYKIENVNMLHLLAERNLVHIAEEYVNYYPKSIYSKSSLQVDQYKVGKFYSPCQDPSEEEEEEEEKRKRREEKAALEASLSRVYPAVVAIRCGCDEMGSLLMKRMTNQRVRDLFEYVHPVKPIVKFRDMLAPPSKMSSCCGHPCGTSHSTDQEQPSMPFSVEVVLDACMNPDWPFNINDSKDRRDKMEVEERAKNPLPWSSIPKDPLRYHMFYRILDGDSNTGNSLPSLESRKSSAGNCTEVANYDPATGQSCLYLIAKKYPERKRVMKHPVIRRLVQRKWELYGFHNMMVRLLLYLAFLLVFTLAFLLQPMAPPKESGTAGQNNATNTTDTIDLMSYSTMAPPKESGTAGQNNATNTTDTIDLMSYSTPQEKARLFCEILLLILTLVYVYDETKECFKDRHQYVREWSNYMDVPGLLLIVACIPCRIAGAHKIEWIFAACAFLINFLRIVKFFPIEEKLGCYKCTIANLVKKELRPFLCLMVVTFLAISGFLVFLIRATNSSGNMHDGEFLKVFRQTISGLVEGAGFRDDGYDGIDAGLTVAVLACMFVITVVVSNIFIAQLSSQYDIVKLNSKVEQDVQRLQDIVRDENKFDIRRIFTWKDFLYGSRVNNYRDEEYISNINEVKEYLRSWKKSTTDEE